MKTTKTYTDDHQVKITAEFEQELLEQYKRRAARKIAKSTRIPGFRPGKAPYHMVLNHVGEASVIQEAIDLLLEAEYPKVLDQEEIKPFGPGNLEEISSYDPLTFEFIVPLEAEVTLVGDDKLDKEYAPEAVTEKEIEQELERIKRNFADVVPADRAAQEGDIVYLTLTGTDKNAEGDDAIVVEDSPLQLLIEAEDVKRPSEWPFEGFGREFIGKKAGSNFTLEHTYPEDARDESLAGKTVEFAINLQEVKELKLPELTEDLLKQLGNYENEESLREDIQKALQNRKNADYDEQYYSGLVDELRDKSTIKYCPQQLDETVEDMLHQLEHQLSHQGMDLELMLKLRKQDKESYIEEEVKPNAVKRLERSLIMKELTRKHELKIDETALEGEIQVVISELIHSGQLEDVKKQLGNKKFSEQVTYEAIDRLLSKAQFELLKSLANPDIIQVEAPKPKKVSSKSKATKKENAVEAEIKEDAVAIETVEETKEEAQE
ncbi:MAG TPA: trigger factor [Anaerolineaceae bacterium]|nr:trigger factor [Anaerolineaceae bacterium]